MPLDVTVATMLHLVFAALWAGAVVFVTWTLLPLAQGGDLDAVPLERVAGSLRNVSRLSSVVLFVTGGHLAGRLYTVDRLFGSGRGHLVLSMVVLWLVLTGLVEVAGARLQDGTERQKVREPARNARPFLIAGSVVSVALLVVGGLLASGFAA